MMYVVLTSWAYRRKKLRRKRSLLRKMFQHHLLGQTARLGFLLLKIETFFYLKHFIFLLNPCFMQLTINPLKETELILYGGEFYNGQKVSFRLFWSLLPLFHLFISVWFSKHAIQNCFFFYVNADICIWWSVPIWCW